MVFKYLCVLVLLTNVALALERLVLMLHLCYHGYKHGYRTEQLHFEDRNVTVNPAPGTKNTILNEKFFLK